MIYFKSYYSDHPEKPIFKPLEPWKPYKLPVERRNPFESAIIATYAMTLTAMCHEQFGFFALHCALEQEDPHKADFEGKENHCPPGVFPDDRPFLLDTSDEES